jgi:DNA-binding beta-propeller fold protein YncE
LGGIAVNPKTGDVYLANDAASHIWELRGKTNKVISTVGVANLVQQYWGLATSPKTGDAYVTDYWNASLDVISS